MNCDQRTTVENSSEDVMRGGEIGVALNEEMRVERRASLLGKWEESLQRKSSCERPAR